MSLKFSPFWVIVQTYKLYLNPQKFSDSNFQKYVFKHDLCKDFKSQKCAKKGCARGHNLVVEKNGTIYS